MNHFEPKFQLYFICAQCEELTEYTRQKEPLCSEECAQAQADSDEEERQFTEGGHPNG